MTTPLKAVPTNERVPPQNIDAERSLLGAMLLSRDAVADAIEVVGTDDFYKPLHGRIFEAIINLFGQGEPVDVVTLAEELRRRDALDDLGGLSYLRALSADTPSISNAAWYAEIVSQTATLRRLIDAASHIADIAYDPASDPKQVIDAAEAAVFEIAQKKTASELEPVRDLLDGTLNSLEELGRRGSGITGTATGFHDFDRLTAGLQPSNLVIVAARPGMGKSTFIANIAMNVSIEQGGTVALFCLEMSKAEMVTRLLAADARIDMQRMKTGNLTDSDWRKLAHSVGRLSEAPLYIDDTGMLNIMEIRAKCRRLAARHPLQLIVIDYLQLLHSSGRSDNRQVEVSEISRSLKVLARELECPIICASQLNRSPEQRADKRPMLADLRESGSLEQDSDLVLFLYRDDYYEQDTNQGEAELIVAKHRSGPTDTIRLAFLQHVSRFENLTYQPDGM